MNTSSFTLIPLAVLAFACPARAQVPAETILPAIIPASQTHAPVKAEHASATPPSAGAAAAALAPVHAAGVVVNPTPTRPAVSPPHATVFSENSGPRRDQTVTYYLPVGAISPRSGLRTYPGNTAAQITNGSTRASSGMAAGSTAARLAGSNGTRASQASTRARTVGTR